MKMPQNINGFLYTLNKSSQTFTILVDITEININYAFVFFLCYAITLFNFNLEITLKSFRTEWNKFYCSMV